LKEATTSQEIMFTLYKSKVNKTNSQYQENYKRMKALVEDLNEKLQMALNQGKESYVKRYLETGKMLARDRIELLLDEVFSITLTS
jgi:acetyl-CoA carboxylase carboxyltransferase component